ncbi:MAG TPA: magnesium transporter [Lachnoclostridium phytofermentans]|uniref:Magnesium transporter MgtE n=1 Tax=Lachnoclostridium phytofermentans TaxID=66219 RepID=A0A3D2XD46_9FIRM|nr:magnesium transporter [Lachnoclostridium sp.]HCL04258.1 magnesium transporter [Lachnoclostridium phytofermentans]
MQEKVLELLENKRFNDLKHILETMNSADIAQILSEVKNEDMILLYRFLTKDTAVETFSYMETELQERLIHAMTDKELHDVTNELFLDDTVDLIEEMPANIVKRILQQTHPDQRKLINEFLKYPSRSAGSVMTIEFIDLKATMTVDEAFTKIRKIGLDKETIYTCYVLDDSRRLQGIVTVKDLLLAKNDTILSYIMETNLITVNTHDDKEEVARKFDKYDFLALPVVDQEFRLVGIITIDDAIDVMQEENTEDFERMAALAPSEDTYFRTSVFQHAKNRIVWLLALMLSATVTGVLITKYEDAFKAIPLLVAFIPMLMDTGGNCGSQTSTLVIRGMALDEIRSKDIFRVFYKEIRVALLVGVALGFVNGLRIFIQYNDLALAFVVGLTLIATVCLSKALGCLLPMVAKFFKLDPALMAAPLITTIVDTCSIMIYFTIALKIMNL